MNGIREKVRFWFDDLTTPMGRAVDIVVIALILLGCVVLVLETYNLGERMNEQVLKIEWVIVWLFAIEYVLRLWAAKDRVAHIFKFYSVIDLLAIFPVLFIATPHLQIVRVIRALRVMRLLRFVRDRHFFFGSVRQSHLDILRIVFTLFIIIFISAGFIWHFEHLAPGSQLNNMGQALYFSVVTLTTVGFGDITPVSTMGKVVVVLMILAGVIFIPWEVKNLIAHATIGTDDNTPDCPRCGLRHHERSARYCQRCGERLVPPQGKES